MPVIVTDSVVLAEIAKTDGLGAAIDGAMTSTPGVPAATLAEWRAQYGAYQAWSKAATADLSGGFIRGAWFGVPEYGDQSLAFEQNFAAWQALINTLAGKTIAPLPTSPLDAANQNAAFGEVGAGGLSTGIVLGVLGLAALLFAVRK